MKRPFAILMLSACMALAAHAQGIVEWQADVARWQSADWDCGRGETLRLAPSFISGRSALDLSGIGEASFHWQTNGMGHLYWSAPARIDTNSRPHRLVADFEPWMDCGAAKYDYFFRAGATNGPVQYRAHGTIRMHGSPGAAPNALPLPVPVLDFARITVTNAPWGEGGGTDGEAVTNIVEGVALTRPEAENGYTEWKPYDEPGHPAGYKLISADYIGSNCWRVVVLDDGESEPFSVTCYSYAADAVEIAFTNDHNSIVRTRLRPTPEMEAAWNAKASASDLDGVLRDSGDQALAGTLSVTRPQSAHGHAPLGADELTVEHDGVTVGKPNTSTTYANGHITHDGNDIALPDRPGALALASDIPSLNGLATAEEVAAARTESSLVYQLMMGSNVVAVVTNYNSRVHAPAYSLLQLNPDTGEYTIVWAETNGLTRTRKEAYAYTDAATNALGLAKADRAWSHTTSGLGADAPKGVTWISTPETVIAGGYEYAKVITTAGEAWVLCSNGMSAGPDTNAYFRVATLDGESLFSVERSDSVLIGVRAGGITCSGNTVSIPLDVVSAEAPVCYACDDLVSQNWVNLSESLPSWVTSATAGGSAGSWVWTIETTAPKGFFQFRALQEGRTVIRNNAPAELSQGIWVNGSRYVPVANGSTLTWTLAQ